MGKQFGMIHYNAPGATVEEFLTFAAEAGFASVELQIGDVWTEGACCMGGAEKVKGILDSLGLKCEALASGNDFVVLEAEKVTAQVERMRTICEIAKVLDCDVIRTEGGQPKDEVPEERWVEAMAGCLKRCAEFAGPMGIKLAVDNHGWVTNEWPIQLELFEACGAPGIVGANFDTMNYRWFGHSLEKLHEVYEAIAPFTFHTHLKDGFGSRETYKGTVLGEGEIDLAWAISCLKKSGYKGVWCVEFEGRAENDEQKAEGYRKSLAWMKANI